jgi:hypothetical protein
MRATVKQTPTLHRWPCWRGAGYHIWGAPCVWNCARPLTLKWHVLCCHSVYCWVTRTPLSTRHSTGCSTDSRSSCPAVPAASTACYPASYVSSDYHTSTATPPQLTRHQPMRLPSDLSTRDISTSDNLSLSGCTPHTFYSSVNCD